LIERLKNEVCVMRFLTQIYPVKWGVPGIQPEEAIHPLIQPDERKNCVAAFNEQDTKRGSCA